jgi:hypothetical protein
VRSRRNGDRLDRRVKSGLLDFDHQATEVRTVDRPQVQEGMAAAEYRPRHLVARGKLVDEPLAVVVEQSRTGAAKGLAEEQPGPFQHRRMELHEFHVRDRGARRHCHRYRVADLAGRVRGPGPERRGAAHRQDRGLCRDRSLGSDDAEASPARRSATTLRWPRGS